jgi:PAS domain-containing protein
MTKPRKADTSSPVWRQAGHGGHGGTRDQLAALRAELGASLRMISKYKTKERALLKEREELLSILDNALCGIGISRKRWGKILYENAGFTRMFGYTTRDIPTVREWFAKVYPDGTVNLIV